MQMNLYNLTQELPHNHTHIHFQLPLLKYRNHIPKHIDNNNNCEQEEEIDDDNWGWDSLLKSFITLEGNQRFNNEHHGINGPLKVSDPKYVVKGKKHFQWYELYEDSIRTYKKNKMLIIKKVQYGKDPDAT